MKKIGMLLEAEGKQFENSGSAIKLLLIVSLSLTETATFIRNTIIDVQSKMILIMSFFSKQRILVENTSGI